MMSATKAPMEVATAADREDRSPGGSGSRLPVMGIEEQLSPHPPGRKGLLLPGRRVSGGPPLPEWRGLPVGEIP